MVDRRTGKKKKSKKSDEKAPLLIDQPVLIVPNKTKTPQKH
jgi:hypothetical protein